MIRPDDGYEGIHPEIGSLFDPAHKVKEHYASRDECRFNDDGLCLTHDQVIEKHPVSGSAWRKGALCNVAAKALRALARRLQRYPFEPICLNCGALKPCMTEADLKPGDPGVPCMFDPTPKQLFEENAALRASLDAWKATSDALAAQRDQYGREAATAKARSVAYDAERTGYRLRAERAEATVDRLMEVIVMGIFPPQLDG